MKKFGALTASALVASGALALFSDSFQGLLSRWEGDGQNIVYQDRLAGGLPTVCRGLTNHTSPYPVIVGDYWSDEKCEEVERQVVSKGQIELADCLPFVTQYQFDALSSFAHKVGVANVCASRAVGLMRAGQHKAGCKAIAYSADGKPVWSSVRDGKNADGSIKYKFVQGLHNRRVAESEHCMAGAR